MNTTKKYLREIVYDVASNENLDVDGIKVSKLVGIAGIMLKFENKEYVVFKTLKSAKKFAKHNMIKYFDDPEMINYLNDINCTIEDYVDDEIELRQEIESVISYDCKHNLQLNNSICYRIN